MGGILTPGDSVKLGAVSTWGYVGPLATVLRPFDLDWEVDQVVHSFKFSWT